MHELSIVKSLIELCQEYAKDREIEKVVVVVGKMAGVEPHFLQKSFDVFKENSCCENAEIELEIEDVYIKCFECEGVGKIKNFNFYCPKCGSEKTKIIKGQELYIKYLQVKEI